MSLSDELDQYEQLMERLVGAYRSRMTKICKDKELTPPQFWAMHTIGELKRVKMSPLADLLGLSMGAASTLIDRLVGRGMVERSPDPDDRRAVFVTLTAKGQQVLDEATAARRAMSRTVFERLTPDDRSHLLSGLAAMVTNWEAAPPGELQES